MTKIVRAELPEVTVGRRSNLKLHGPRTPLGFECIALADDMVAIYTHHNPEDGKPWPCQGEDCRFNHRNNLPRYRAYLPALMRQTCELFIAELTERAARDLLSDPRAGCGLRGLLIHLFRESKDKKAKMRCRVKGLYHAELPPAFDPMPSMLNYWGIAEQAANARAFEQQLRTIEGCQIVTSSVDLAHGDGENEGPPPSTRPASQGPTPKVPGGSATCEMPTVSDLSHLSDAYIASLPSVFRRVLPEVREPKQTGRD